MPHKDPEMRKRYMRERYQRKAEEIKEYQKQYRAENGEKITETRRPYQRRVYLMNRVVRRLAFILRAGGKCVVCGHDDLRVLEFHHRDPAMKIFEIGAALAAGSKLKYPMDDMFAEADKCDLLCANCHHRRHNTWTDDELTEMLQIAEKYFADEEETFNVPSVSVSDRGPDLGASITDERSPKTTKQSWSRLRTNPVSEALGHA